MPHKTVSQLHATDRVRRSGCPGESGSVCILRRDRAVTRGHNSIYYITVTIIINSHHSLMADYIVNPQCPLQAQVLAPFFTDMKTTAQRGCLLDTDHTATKRPGLHLNPKQSVLLQRVGSLPTAPCFNPENQVTRQSAPPQGPLIGTAPSFGENHLKTTTSKQETSRGETRVFSKLLRVWKQTPHKELNVVLRTRCPRGPGAP